VQFGHTSRLCSKKGTFKDLAILKQCNPNNNTERYQLLFILKEFAQLFSSDGIQTMFNNLPAATPKEDKLFVILHGFSSFLNKSN
ncbi:hypothetical protein CEXT_497031, partial [Caerostris extrusa]